MEKIDMTTSIGLKLTEYRATPWSASRYGEVEWPPSPYRLLRALISTYYTYNHDLPESTVEDLIIKLASAPSFSLPPAAVGHDRTSTSHPLTIPSSFVSLHPSDTLFVTWNSDDVLKSPDLGEHEYRLLDRLVSSLKYLGRRDSHVSASIHAGLEVTLNCQPLQWPDADPVKYDLVRVLVADPSDPDLVNHLKVDTQSLTDSDQIDTPPGARWIYYTRPANCFSVSYRWSRDATLPAPRGALFILTGPDLPDTGDSVVVGELVRRGLMSKSQQLTGGHARPVFSGKDGDGRARSGHQHASYLPLDLDGDGLLDAVVVWAPAGFSEIDRHAMNRLNRIWSGDDSIRLKIILSRFLTRTTSAKIPVLGAGRVWRSRTPFVPVRHPKKNGRDSIEAQLAVELQRRGLPDAVTVEPIQSDHLPNGIMKWQDFRCRRRWGGGSGVPSLASGFRIELEKEVSGPISLGYGSHFGLGLFEPIDPERSSS